MTATGLRVLVVDDETPSRDELTFLLGQQREITSVRTAVDAGGCLRALEEERVDALFLDVRMPVVDGVELARVVQRMENPPQVVFVTAFEEYAVEAFGLAAVDYLLKPVRPDRLRVTVQRLHGARHEAAEGSMTVTHGGGPAAAGGQSGTAADGDTQGLTDRLAVLSGGHIVLLPMSEIRVISIEGDRVVVRSGQGHFIARHPLAELETRLHGRGFLRVHRAHLVNLRHLTTVESFFNGTYLLKLRDVSDLTVPVSRRHAADLRAAIRL